MIVKGVFIPQDKTSFYAKNTNKQKLNLDFQHSAGI